jgi:hypothetical protein
MQSMVRPPVIGLFDSEGGFGHLGQTRLNLGKPLLQSNAIAMILGYWQPGRAKTRHPCQIGVTQE